ncbi:MAG: GIY-YIG nuclease family protein [Alphaproteobacteria bacterium]
MKKDGRCFVYILASAKHGTLYVGMSCDLLFRIQQHRDGRVAGFTKTYGVKLLVYVEECADPPSAYLRERQIKKWKRDWKIELVESVNPNWVDLFPTLQL